MTAYWGPAFEAEIAYRQEQVRLQVVRTHRFGRRGVRPTVPQPAPLGRTPAIPLQRTAAEANADRATASAGTSARPAA
jgi:hypothetical protein